MANMVDTKTNHFGLHLMFDAYRCPIEVLSSMELVYGALNQLSRDLGMIQLSPPIVIKAPGNNKKDPGGYSGFVVIAESHISIHTFDKRGFVSVDIYSCKDFDVDKAVSDLVKLFKPKKTEVHIVVRGKGYPKENIYK